MDRYAFAHGCLNGHLLAGEERFCVEWDRSDGSVWWAARCLPLLIVLLEAVDVYAALVLVVAALGGQHGACI